MSEISISEAKVKYRIFYQGFNGLWNQYSIETWPTFALAEAALPIIANPAHLKLKVVPDAGPSDASLVKKIGESND